MFLRLVSKLEFQISLNKSYFQKLPFQAFNQKKVRYQTPNENYTNIWIRGWNAVFLFIEVLHVTSG